MRFTDSIITAQGQELLARAVQGGTIEWGTAQCATDTADATTTDFAQVVADGSVTSSRRTGQDVTLTAYVSNSGLQGGRANSFGIFAKIEGDAEEVLAIICTADPDVPCVFPAHDGTEETLLTALIAVGLTLSDTVISDITVDTGLYALQSDLAAEANARARADTAEARARATHEGTMAEPGTPGHFNFLANGPFAAGEYGGTIIHTINQTYWNSWFVTTDTTQTITGEKTFAGGIKTNTLTSASGGTISVGANIVPNRAGDALTLGSNDKYFSQTFSHMLMLENAQVEYDNKTADCSSLVRGDGNDLQGVTFKAICCDESEDGGGYSDTIGLFCSDTKESTYMFHETYLKGTSLSGSSGTTSTHCRLGINFKTGGGNAKILGEVGTRAFMLNNSGFNLISTGMNIAGNIIPSTNEAYDIGAVNPNKRFNRVYTKALFAENLHGCLPVPRDVRPTAADPIEYELESGGIVLIYAKFDSALTAIYKATAGSEIEVGAGGIEHINIARLYTINLGANDVVGKWGNDGGSADGYKFKLLCSVQCEINPAGALGFYALAMCTGEAT